METKSVQVTVNSPEIEVLAEASVASLGVEALVEAKATSHALTTGLICVKAYYRKSCRKGLQIRGLARDLLATLLGQ